MNKINRGTGAGGANTNLHGIAFEESVYLRNWIENAGFVLKNVHKTTKRVELFEIYDQEKFVGYYGRQGQIYNALKKIDNKKFSTPYIKSVLSKKIHPDAFILTFNPKRLTIFEKKWQQSSGSVDEKIQTAPFKLEMFEKLTRGSGIQCQYHYILSDWFQKDEYRNVREYYELLYPSKIQLWINGLNLHELNIEEFIK